MDRRAGWIIGGNHLLMERREAKNLHVCLFAIISSVFLWIVLEVQHINKMFPFFYSKISAVSVAVIRLPSDGLDLML